MDYRAFFLIFFLYVTAASSDSLQEFDHKDHGIQEQHTSMREGNPRKDIIRGRKFVRGAGDGAGKGAGTTSPSENGNGNGNKSPYVQGGALIPLYGHSKHHHGAGNCIQNCLKLPSLIITTMVYAIIHLNIAYVCQI